jgi:hypothetical protein
VDLFTVAAPAAAESARPGRGGRLCKTIEIDVCIGKRGAHRFQFHSV